MFASMGADRLGRGKTRVGAVYASPPKRYVKPMKRPSKLEGLYLVEFKRILAWASCRRLIREFWQGIGSKSQREFEETA
jgi:hypothetical protein